MLLLRHRFLFWNLRPILVLRSDSAADPYQAEALAQEEEEEVDCCDWQRSCCGCDLCLLLAAAAAERGRIHSASSTGLLELFDQVVLLTCFAPTAATTITVTVTVVERI